MSPKILIYDIETSPLISLTWGTYKQNVAKVVQEWHMLSFAYKWLGEKRVYVVAQPDFKTRYKKDKTDDYGVAKKLWELFSEADITDAHNGDSFDIKKANSRFLYHGLGPYPEPKSTDTLKMVRKKFAQTSNKLNDISVFLGHGEKEKHEGIDLWWKCMNGDEKAWKKMIAYNKRDVELQEKAYLELRRWQTTGPDMRLYVGDRGVCRHCGSRNLVIHQKKYYANTTWRYQYRCQSCMGFTLSHTSHKLEELNLVN